LLGELFAWFTKRFSRTTLARPTSKVIEVLTEVKQESDFLVSEVKKQNESKIGCAKPLVLAQTIPSVTEC